MPSSTDDVSRIILVQDSAADDEEDDAESVLFIKKYEYQCTKKKRKFVNVARCTATEFAKLGHRFPMKTNTGVGICDARGLNESTFGWIELESYMSSCARMRDFEIDQNS